MKLLKLYIQDFIIRAGNYVFIATIISRFLSFLASWVALQLIPNKELGVVLFAFNIISFIIPFSGLGLSQGLIRYGALLKTKQEKDNLFSYTFKKGIFVSILMILSIIVTSYFIPFEFENTYTFLALLSFLVLPMFAFEMLKIKLRLEHNNKQFAFTEIIYNTILIILVFILSSLYREIGYVFALLLAPTITVLVFYKNSSFTLKTTLKPSIVDISFWKYGFFASLANVATQLLFVIDIFLIGYLLKDAEMVTNYRYVSIIPFSILFLPRVFIATDFVAFTEKIYNKKYIFNYIKSYMLLFFIVSILLLLFSVLFAEEILSIFDDSFIQFSSSFIILTIGVSGILLLRGLFGNLLSSIGKAHVNYYIISVALIINVISNYYLIPNFGIKGAAITSALLMWFTGITSAICFAILYKKEVNTTS
ncbi:polysaccharide biosynthesis C-terminal domain-containing protein [Tenacibaculum aquimarinum]|uniref:polysaccharide biosynthesis C-terminal domain-containing protein n=1 Tax=Tenacibaculum aquimarinum TaxID=2910675 RepID=UPI001F0A3448|nr:polysaccharide biosynthesis C-terminal domain-containing protein [Tenacibaculum aquimarinum]MCH3884273.1 polysaccharide biosynthesis C-terminal domain-containing protein [Tenacibaculum aquimarinum]